MSPRTRSFKQNCLLHDAVVSNVAEFLDVRSLVYFFSCSKKMQGNIATLCVEVTRRKAVFAEAKKCVAGLLKQHEEPPSREHIYQAQESLLHARRWVELFEGELQGMELRESLGVSPRADPLFAVERAQLGGSFRVLPTCFYFPSVYFKDLRILPSDDVRQFCEQHARYVWDAMQEHQRDFLEAVSPVNDEKENEALALYTDSKSPFRQFEHPAFVDFRDETMLSLVAYLKREPERREAFRNAARKLATKVPKATLFLHFMTHHLDHEFCKECGVGDEDDAEEEMSEVTCDVDDDNEMLENDQDEESEKDNNNNNNNNNNTDGP